MTTPTIPRRMIPFFGLAGLVMLGLLLGGCGQKTPSQTPQTGNTQQVSSSQETSDYQANTVYMTPSEAARYGIGEGDSTGSYDSGGSKATFPPPSYRTAAPITYGSSPDPFEYSTTASGSITENSAVQTGAQSGGPSLNNAAAGTYTVAYASSYRYSGGDPVFHGAHAQGSDSVFHGAHASITSWCPNPEIYSPSTCGTSVDPVFHGAHY